jgi:AcrR family transcriptional regulator
MLSLLTFNLAANVDGVNMPGETVAMVRKINTSRNARGRPAAYHHGELRAALVRAAGEMVEERGPTGLSLREAARCCGVSQAAPYRHFASREALLAAVAAKGFRAFAQTLFEHARDSDGPLSRLKDMCRGYVAFAREHPETLRLMFGPECAKGEDPDLEQAANDAYALLEETVAGLEAPSLDRHVISVGVWALAHGLARLLIDMPGEPPGFRALGEEACIEQVINGFLDGLLPASESPATGSGLRGGNMQPTTLRRSR